MWGFAPLVLCLPCFLKQPQHLLADTACFLAGWRLRVQPTSLSMRSEQINAHLIAQIKGAFAVAPHMASLQLFWLLSCMVLFLHLKLIIWASGRIPQWDRSSRSGIAKRVAVLHGLSTSGGTNSNARGELQSFHMWGGTSRRNSTHCSNAQSKGLDTIWFVFCSALTSLLSSLPRPSCGISVEWAAIVNTIAENCSKSFLSFWFPFWNVFFFSLVHTCEEKHPGLTRKCN